MSNALTCMKIYLYYETMTTLIYLFTVKIHWRVRGLSSEPNNQLNVFKTSVTEGEVWPVNIHIHVNVFFFLTRLFKW